MIDIVVAFFLLASAACAILAFHPFKCSIWLTIPVYSWVLIYLFIPALYLLSPLNYQFAFLLVGEFFAFYLASTLLFFVGMKIGTRARTTELRYYEKYDVTNMVLITYFLLFIVVVWKVLTSELLIFSDTSRSDILMADQSRQVKEGGGLALFLRLFEYLYYIFLGVILMRRKAVRYHLLIFNLFVAFTIVNTIISGLFRSPIFYYAIFGILVNFVVYRRSRSFPVLVASLALVFPFAMSFWRFTEPVKYQIFQAYK